MIVAFQFGDSQKLRLVRILRSTVMVRVGGGWVALDEFLLKNDPCRGKYLLRALILRDISRGGRCSIDGSTLLNSKLLNLTIELYWTHVQIIIKKIHGLYNGLFEHRLLFFFFLYRPSLLFRDLKLG